MKKPSLIVMTLSLISASYGLNTWADAITKADLIRSIKRTGLTQTHGKAYRVLDADTSRPAGHANCLAHIRTQKQDTYLEIEVLDDYTLDFKIVPNRVSLDTQMSISKSTTSFGEEAFAYKLPLRRDKTLCMRPYQEAQIQDTLLIASNQKSIEIKREVNFSRCDELRETYGDRSSDSLVCEVR